MLVSSVVQLFFLTLSFLRVEESLADKSGVEIQSLSSVNLPNKSSMKITWHHTLKELQKAQLRLSHFTQPILSRMRCLLVRNPSVNMLKKGTSQTLNSE